MTDRWVILSKPECPWCTMVMDLLHEYDIEFTEMNIVGTDLVEFMVNSGLYMVPQVFKNGDLVGGFEDVEAYLSW
jgi:glutaredoxin 3